MIALAAALAGVVILALAVAGASHPVIHPAEQAVFRRINGLPDWLYRPLWPPMQLGNLVVGTAAGLVAALGLGSWSTALGVLAAMALKLITERVVRHRIARFAAVRQRPGTTEPGAVLRGDVPATGASFPSGHVILVTAIGCVLLTAPSWVWPTVPLVLAVVVAVGRVYVGAHNPLDVVAGFGTGLLVGGLLAFVLR